MPRFLTARDVSQPVLDLIRKMGGPSHPISFQLSINGPGNHIEVSTTYHPVDENGELKTIEGMLIIASQRYRLVPIDDVDEPTPAT